VSTIKDDNYFTVKGWMINKLGLSGSALIAYAVIYGFSQDGKSSFRGSISYLASCAGVTKRGMIKALHGLLEKGYITKIQKDDDTLCNVYMAVNPQKVLPPSEESSTEWGEESSCCENKVHQINKQSSPNIISILDLDKDLNNIKSHTDQARVKTSAQKNKEHFIKLWQSHPDVFNPLARFKDPNDFNAWWEKSDVTAEMIDTAVANFVNGVRDGSIERRYIPGNPDTFILNGGIQRYQTPYRSRASPNAEMSPERRAELDKFITGVKL
jgi:hypothetical protein